MRAPLTPAAFDGGLGEARRSVRIPTRSGFRRFLAYSGPGALVAVGYMDPGNWATNLAGGSAFGYGLLWVVLLSSGLAMLLQTLAAKLGIVTGMDLAQACRKRSSRRSAIAQWLFCEFAICAADLAEIIGSAIALELLFHIPLPWGVALTSLDALFVLWLQQRGFRRLEAFVVALIATIVACFAAMLVMAHLQLDEFVHGLVPSASTLEKPGALLIAVGILGATVMPHNLYLHSATVQTRCFAQNDAGKAEAIRFAKIDVLVSLGIALLVNVAIMVVAASVFHAAGRHEIVEIQQAYHLLTPLLGSASASLLFGIALLACGISSTVTATLTGQIVMEGFVNLRVTPWKRRLITRGLAVIPAFFVAVLWGEGGTARLILASQIVLSLQLPFAVVPLLRLTSDRTKMGRFANSPALRIIAWAAAALIVVLNVLLIVRLVG